MGKIPITAFVVVAVLGMAVYFGLMSLAALKTYAEPGVRTMEKKPTDVQKAEPLADKVDSKDVEVKKLSNQVYRVEVKATAEGRAAYEKEWEKFCVDHPTARWSPAPPDGQGNTGITVLYWNVDEK